MWEKVLKNGPSNICGRHPLKSLKRYGLRPISKYFRKKYIRIGLRFGPGKLQ